MEINMATLTAFSLKTVEPLRQEQKAPFQNATSRDWQKAFNPQRELGAFCSGARRKL
jgi:hypothetical protein